VAKEVRRSGLRLLGLEVFGKEADILLAASLEGWNVRLRHSRLASQIRAVRSSSWHVSGACPLKGNHVVDTLVIHAACFDTDSENSAELRPDAEGAGGEGGAGGGEVVFGVDGEEGG